MRQWVVARQSELKQSRPDAEATDAMAIMGARSPPTTTCCEPILVAEPQTSFPRSTASEVGAFDVIAESGLRRDRLQPRYCRLQVRGSHNHFQPGNALGSIPLDG